MREELGEREGLSTACPLTLALIVSTTLRISTQASWYCGCMYEREREIEREREGDRES